MYCCSACKKDIPLKSIEELRAHLNSHKLFLRLRFPIQCNQKPCRASTGGIKEYVRHFKTFHLDDLDLIVYNNDNDIYMHDLDAESVENHTEADRPESVERIFIEDGFLTSCTEIFEKLKKNLILRSA